MMKITLALGHCCVVSKRRKLMADPGTWELTKRIKDLELELNVLWKT